ncbi:MAG: L-threonine 3-dehydrogenase [Armatimonadetes bacterium]|nr:L-threonine 3-dehydrogenase [Armatimonadota bacterium]
MKAIVKSAPRPGVEVLDVKQPALGSRDVLIKIRIAGICGTDLHIYSWDEWSAGRVHPPVILGHEFCGDVVQIGPEVKKAAVGDYVTGECHITCGVCYQCRIGQAHVCSNVRVCGIDRNGSFAEYISLPEDYIWKVSPSIPSEIAAIFDPIGNAVHTVLAGEISGATVAVIGCGPIGIAAISIAQASGATRVVGFDVSDYRLQLAVTMGADDVVNSSTDDPVDAARKINGAGFDVVIEMSGNPAAINQAFKMVRPGGRVSLLGLPKSPVQIDLANDVVLKGLVVQGIHGRRMFKTWYQMTRIIESGRVDFSPLITHQMTFDEVDRAMEIMASGHCGKVLLRPG